MGVFEKLPYLNYHDINLDWLVRQTKKNASDNTYLMKIFKWFQDQGLVGTVTNVTENPDDTVKIDYADFENNTTDDFTVYNKNGVDGLVSGAVSDAETYADGVGTAANTYADNLMKGLANLPAETDLQDTDLLLINRSGVAEAVNGETLGKKITTQVLNNVDLNTMYGQAYTGMYFVNEGCTNHIADYSGLFIIGYGSMSFQIGWTKYELYFRGRTGGSWSAWKKVISNASTTLVTYTVDCNSAGDAGTYVGTYTITDHPNAFAIIPAFARKGGTSYIYNVAVESGTIRIQGAVSTTGITVGVYVIE